MSFQETAQLSIHRLLELLWTLSPRSHIGLLIELFELIRYAINFRLHALKSFINFIVFLHSVTVSILDFASIRFASRRLFEHLRYFFHTFLVSLYGLVLTGNSGFHLLAVVDELFVDCYI